MIRIAHNPVRRGCVSKPTAPRTPRSLKLKPMFNLVRSFLRHQAMQHGRFAMAYKKLCHPTGAEHAEFLRRHGELHSIGKDTRIDAAVVMTDPAYVRIGSNVGLSACFLIGHDGAVAMLNRAYGVKLDAVGKIDIRDNVFVGFNAIILPGVTIGPNAIVGAGAVVTKDVAEGDIVAGVPAKVIGTVPDLLTKLQARSQALPWYDLIQQRDGSFDRQLEPELVRRRVEYFYGGREASH